MNLMPDHLGTFEISEGVPLTPHSSATFKAASTLLKPYPGIVKIRRPAVTTFPAFAIKVGRIGIFIFSLESSLIP